MLDKLSAVAWACRLFGQLGNSKLGQIRETIKVNLCFLKFPPTAFQSTFKRRQHEELGIFYTS